MINDQSTSQPSELVNREVVKQVAVPSLMINVLSLALPLTILQIYDRILPNQSYGTAVLLISGAFVALTAEAFLRFVRTWLLSASASNTERDTYKRMLQKLNRSDSNATNTLGVGALHEGLQSISLVKDYYSGGIVASLIDVPFVIIFLGLVYYVGGSLVLIPIAVWIVAAALVWLATLTAQSHSRDASNHLSVRSGFLMRTLGMLEVVKRQASETALISKFRRLSEQKSLSSSAAEQRTAIAQETIQVASMATSVAIVLVGALIVLDGEMTTGGLAACSILSGRAVQPLSALIGLRMRYDSFVVANEAVAKINNLPSHPNTDGAKDIDGPFRTLICENVSFLRHGHRYSFNGRFEPGGIYNLNSEYSFIRSHALGVVAGLNEFQSGDILWNDRPIKSINFQSYQNHCHYLAQRPVLFSGSVLENLCNFNPDLAERALSFAKVLKLDQIIAELPAGTETKVGMALEAPLSTGAIRLINLTALLAQSKRVIIIDAPEKYLDTASMDALARLLKFLASKGAVIILATDQSEFLDIVGTTIYVESTEGDSQ